MKQNEDHKILSRRLPVLLLALMLLTFFLIKYHTRDFNRSREDLVVEGIYIIISLLTLLHQLITAVLMLVFKRAFASIAFMVLYIIFTLAGIGLSGGTKYIHLCLMQAITLYIAIIFERSRRRAKRV